MDSSRRPLADTSNSSAQSPSPRRPVGSKSAAFKSTRRRQPSKSHRSTKAKKAATTKENLKEVHLSPPIPKKSNVCNSADFCATTQTNNLELDLDERLVYNPLRDGIDYDGYFNQAYAHLVTPAESLHYYETMKALIQSQYGVVEEYDKQNNGALETISEPVIYSI